MRKGSVSKTNLFCQRGSPGAGLQGKLKHSCKSDLNSRSNVSIISVSAVNLTSHSYRSHLGLFGTVILVTPLYKVWFILPNQKSDQIIEKLAEIDVKMDEKVEPPTSQQEKPEFPCPYSPSRKPYGSKQAKVNLSFGPFQTLFLWNIIILNFNAI